MLLIAFIEDPRVVRAILVHLSRWDAPRPRPPAVTPGAKPVELDYLPWVD